MIKNRKATAMEMYSIIVVSYGVYLNTDFKRNGALFLLKMDLVLAALVVIPNLIKMYLTKKHNKKPDADTENQDA